MMKKKILVNGISSETGKMLVPPIDEEEFRSYIRDGLLKKRETLVPYYKKIGRMSHARMFAASLLTPHEEEPKEAGWGLIINKDEDKRVFEVLQDLIEHRNGKVIYYEGEERLEEWINKNQLEKEAPFYLLIVGSPQKIPFEFQYLLDSRFAVGRIYFETLEEYTNYVNTVIDYENGKINPVSKRAVFFATDGGYGDATYLSHNFMIGPLVQLAKEEGYEVDYLEADKATERNLKEAVSAGNKRPAFIYTASHGLGCPTWRPDQEYLQGALCCQDFHFAPFKNVKPDDGLLTGYDIGDDFNAYTSIWFAFACFGAGTPRYSEFAHWVAGQGLEECQGKRDFIAYLPMKMLGYKKPALAFVGHIDPAWVHSFMTPSDEAPENWASRLLPFEVAVKYILNGLPVGYACKKFGENYSVLSILLLQIVRDYERSREMGLPVIDPYWDIRLTNIWITRNDCQNYVILGDPAVRVRL